MALAVVFGHSAPISYLSFVYADVAVQAFFIISGFYMSLVLNNRYVGNRAYSLFITNRFLRLFPAYWVVLLVTALLMIPGEIPLFRDWNNGLKFSTAMYLLLSNVFMLGTDLSYFLSLTADGGLEWTKNFMNAQTPLYTYIPLAQVWSISVEIVFYILAPLFLRRTIWFCVGFVATSLLVRAALWTVGLTYDPFNHRLLPIALGYFFIGAISHRFYNFLGPEKLKSMAGYVIWVVLAIYCLVYGHFTFVGQKYPFLILLSLGLPFLFQVSKNLKVDRYIGELSYPIYLVHPTIILVGDRFIDKRIGGMALTLLSIVAAVILNELICAPIERWRQKRVA